LTDAVQGVPSSEMLRQAALQRSWRRDRAVSARKRAWRWVAWLTSRWALPVVVAAALGQVPTADRGDAQLALGEPARPFDAAQGGSFKLSRSLGPPLQAAPAAPPPAAEPQAGIVLKTELKFDRKENK
jgi:hypothetical protein